MTAAVKFTIRAPLVSWSETGAAYKPTDTVPSWSAITGMVGAALGWPRGDERLVQFAGQYAMAVAVHQTGQRMVDYHTVQTPHRPSLGKTPPYTRQDELKAVHPTNKQLHTSPTQREYVQDAHYTIVLVPIVDDPITSAPAVVAGLRNPVYPLYAGRRSCPLGMVPAELIEGDKVEDWLPNATHWDTRLPCDSPHSLVRERRDLLIAAHPRRFDVRREAVA